MNPEETLERSQELEQQASEITGVEPVLTDPNIITGDLLEPQEELNVSEPQETPVFPVADMDIPEPTLTESETEAQTLTDELRALNRSLEGQSAMRTRLEEERGIPTLEQDISDLSGRLNAIQSEAKAIPLQLQQESEGRGRTRGGLRPLQTARLRENAIQALSVSSILEAKRGNLTLAQDQIDRAVAQKFDPIRERINTRQRNLDLILNSPRASLQEKKRAQAQKRAQEVQEQQLEQEQEEFKNIQQIAVQAAQQGISNQVIQRIQNADTTIEANRIAEEAGLFDEQNTFEMRTVGGDLVEVELNPQGQVVNQRVVRGGSGDDDDQGLTDTVIRETSEELNATRGDDGFVNTAAYVDVYNEWLRLGGTPDEFKKQFPPEAYVNPNDSTVPPILRPETDDDGRRTTGGSDDDEGFSFD